MSKKLYNECPDCGGRKTQTSSRCSNCARGGRKPNLDSVAAEKYGVTRELIILLGGARRLNALEPCFRDVLLKAMCPGKSKDLILALRKRGMPRSNARFKAKAVPANMEAA